MPVDSIHAYHRYMWENLFSRIDIVPANVHMPPGTIAHDEVEQACRAYEEEILRAGGIDFQILGIGKTGHIGFNEPGSGELEQRNKDTAAQLDRLGLAEYFAMEAYVIDAP